MIDIWRNVQERGTKVIVLTLSPGKVPERAHRGYGTIDTDDEE